jgi:hypothetical protein
VFSAVAGQPAGIRDNVASEQGGGLFARTNDRINGPPTTWRTFLWNAELEGNTAPTGAAIYTDGDSIGVDVWFNPDVAGRPAPPSFVCPVGQFCGGIIDNVAQRPDGTPTNGAVIHMIREGRLDIGRHDADRPLRGGMTIEGNRGGRLIFIGDDSSAQMENVLIADNQVSLPLIEVGNGGAIKLVDATLGGNTIAGANPILQSGDGAVGLFRSILWEPGHTVLQCSGCTRTFERVMANERGSLDGGNGTQVVVADPRFVDASNGDYQLRAASPAVDYVGAGAGGERDTLSRARDIDLPITAGAFAGVRDIGAFERPSLQPLVLNSDLDIDNRTWTVVIPGAVFDDPLNISGGAGSGSLRVYQTGVVRGQPFIAARQCVHLPGPARYALNGWGRTQPNGLFIPPLDSTALLWEVRHNGAEDCTGGTITARGTLNLSSAGWVRPESPALIDISPADWTSRTSVLINLVVVDNSVAPSAANAEGWFDGITLEVVAPDGSLFGDGFD